MISKPAPRRWGMGWASVFTPCLLAGLVMAQPSEMATTQPAATSAPAPQSPLPPRMAMAVERLNDYVNQLGLSDDQKTQVQKLFPDTRQKLQRLRQQTQAEAAALAPKIQEIVQELRAELGDLLTPEQLEKLRSLIAQGGGLRGEGAGRGGDMMAPMMPSDGRPQQPQSQNDAGPAQPELPMIDAGRPAPDFTLKKLDSQQPPLQLSSFKGKIVLLVFGSYSSPSFRQRAAALEQIRQEYGNRISLFIVYTRENHPAGQSNIERNKADGIAVEQPTDIEGRLALARQARSTLKLTVPILFDTMQDTTAQAYGGLTTNAAYLIGRDGSVLARQQWFEPYSMKRQIDQAVRGVNSGDGRGDGR
jgi:hypothetical protein